MRKTIGITLIIVGLLIPAITILFKLFDLKIAEYPVLGWPGVIGSAIFTTGVIVYRKRIRFP